MRLQTKKTSTTKTMTTKATTTKTTTKKTMTMKTTTTKTMTMKTTTTTTTTMNTEVQIVMSGQFHNFTMFERRYVHDFDTNPRKSELFASNSGVFERPEIVTDWTVSHQKVAFTLAATTHKTDWPAYVKKLSIP